MHIGDGVAGTQPKVGEELNQEGGAASAGSGDNNVMPWHSNAFDFSNNFCRLPRTVAAMLRILL
jgi:hypothetical protein